MTLSEYRDWLENQITEIGPRFEALIQARKILLEAEAKHGKVPSLAQPKISKPKALIGRDSIRLQVIAKLRQQATSPERALSTAQLAQTGGWTTKRVSNALWYAKTQGIATNTEDHRWYLAGDKRESINGQ